MSAELLKELGIALAGLLTGVLGQRRLGNGRNGRSAKDAELLIELRLLRQAVNAQGEETRQALKDNVRTALVSIAGEIKDGQATIKREVLDAIATVRRDLPR